MRSDGPAVACVDLVKTYRGATGEVRALRGVSFEFPGRQLIAVAGPSGSGKSSLLRLLAGLDRPTSGSVTVAGVRVDRARARQLRSMRRGVVGYVFQRPSDNFFPHLTLGEHLRLAARAARRRPRIDPQRLVELLGLAHRVAHRPAELSGGEQQRGALAQVLVSGAEIVVADEPTAELDTGSARHLLDATEQLIADGVTFVVATHDPAVVVRAGATLRLDHGDVVSAPAIWRPGSERAVAGNSVGPAPRSAAASTTPVPDRPTVLEVRHVSKSYRRGTEIVHAVSDVTLSLEEGELVGLLGRSGSGKTTLLNLVSGWEQADGGEVRMVGDAGGDAPPWSELAVVPQKLGLMEELTIRENVEYPARLAGRLDELATRVDGLLDALGLRELQRRHPRETSVGEQQRAAVARALVLSPRLVLADEPTGHQDAGWSRGVLQALGRAVADGTACLTATHSQELTRYLDRALGMTDGRLAEEPGD